MPKRKCTVLSVKAKNDLDDLERGLPVSECVAKYGIAKQTISDIKKKKEQIRGYAKAVASGTSISDPTLGKKGFKLGQYVNVEEATLKWCRQQKSVGITIRSYELKNPAFRFWLDKWGLRGSMHPMVGFIVSVGDTVYSPSVLMASLVAHRRKMLNHLGMS